MNEENINDNKYFINRNIYKTGVTTDDGETSKLGKALWTIIPGIILVIIVMGVIALTQSFLMGIPTLLICLVFYTYILRKMVFDENHFKRLIANNDVNAYMSFGMFNNVAQITDDNQVFFQTSKKGLSSAFFVTFDYASLLDESNKANVNTIRNALVPFLKALHDNHFYFKLYDVSIRSSISLGTLNAVKRTNEVFTPDSWVQLVEMLQNESVSALEQNKSEEPRMYFEIFNSDNRNVVNFKNILDGIIKSTLNNAQALINPHICDLQEILTFNVNYYQITTVPLEERNVRDTPVSKYFNFIAFLDVNGQEYPIDAFEPKYSKTNENVLFNVEQKSNSYINNQLSKQKSVKNKEKSIEESNKNKEIRAQQMQERQTFKKTGIIKPHGILDKNYQQNLKQKEMNDRNKERLEKQNKQMLDNQIKRKNTENGGNVSLNDLLNMYDDKK